MIIAHKTILVNPKLSQEENFMNETKTLPRMGTIREASQTFGLSEYYIRQLALRGTVRAVRAGKAKIFINMGSLSEYLENSVLYDEADSCYLEDVLKTMGKG
jgi:hypothetical protein